MQSSVLNAAVSEFGKTEFGMRLRERFSGISVESVPIGFQARDAFPHP